MCMTETETTTSGSPEGPSPKQAAFLTDLLDKRTGYTPEFAERVREAVAGKRAMSRKQASDAIDWLLAKPKVAATSGTGAKVPMAEVGLYRANDGQVWKVYLTQTKRTAGKVLVVTEAAGGTWAGRFEYVRGGQYTVSKALAAGTTHAMTEAEAIEFGRQYSICCNCAADLSEDRSIAAGFGPTCAGHRGWHYPTKAEAAEILGRPIL